MSVSAIIACVVTGIAGITIGYFFALRRSHFNSAPDEVKPGGDATRLPQLLRAVAGQLEHQPDVRDQIAEAVRLADEQSREMERIIRDSRTDPLTGLSNRRALDEHVPLLVSAARRYATPLSVIMIDIDHFKRLNDQHGHAAGDAALREVAGMARAGLRDADFVARYGGDEFVIVLPQTDLAGANMAAERLRRAIEGAPCRVGGQQIPITISMGLAQMRQTDQFAAVQGRADIALQLAKQAGRNRIRTEKDVDPAA